MTRIKILCEDKYEAEKLASLIFIKDGQETYITAILNVVQNEMIISLKDKSAHSILLKDATNVEVFADFVQSIIEGQHKITSTEVSGDTVHIVKY